MFAFSVAISMALLAIYCLRRLGRSLGNKFLYFLTACVLAAISGASFNAATSRVVPANTVAVTTSASDVHDPGTRFAWPWEAGDKLLPSAPVTFTSAAAAEWSDGLRGTIQVKIKWKVADPLAAADKYGKGTTAATIKEINAALQSAADESVRTFMSGTFASAMGTTEALKSENFAQVNHTLKALLSASESAQQGIEVVEANVVSVAFTAPSLNEK